jgi:hypothetical protein
MKRHALVFLIVLFWASTASAQQTTGAAATAEGAPAAVFEGFIGPTYIWTQQDGNAATSKYEYLEPSLGGDLFLEYDSLPHRFDLETHYLNQKDFFGAMYYAYHDVVVVNLLTRGIYHNFDHLSFGRDNPSTPSPSVVDLNPADEYAVENTLRKAFVRFKTPDFPFHVYAGVTTIDRDGAVQQRFMRGYTGALNIVSQTRKEDWRSAEVVLGVNSHLGPVEADYSHMEKKFEAHGADKTMNDSYPLMTVPHNEVPDLASSSDTVKLHTSHTGKVAAAAAYSGGTKKNKDSDAKTVFRNSAGDLTLTPMAGLMFFLKYRHNELSQSDPMTTTVSGLGATYAVRTPLMSKRDVMEGVARYRVNERLTVKGGYVVETIMRATGNGAVLAPLPGAETNEWDAAHRTLKSTGKFDVIYRLSGKLSLRANYGRTQVTNPAYAADPDLSQTGKTTVIWTPVKRIIAMVGYGGSRDRRNELSAPLGGGALRVERDQAVGSVSFLGNRSTLTAGYMYYRNRTKETITFTDASGLFALEEGVPYGDKAEVFSLAASHALDAGVTLTADASKSFSRGTFRLYGTVPGAEGIDLLSDMNVVEELYSAGLQIQVNKNMGGEVRYQHRHYHDKIDNTRDGRVNTELATLFVKW